MDVRGYVNALPPGALTEQGQRDLMPKGAEIYVEDRKGRQIDSLIASVRKGSLVAVAETYLLAPGAFRPQKRRRLLGERIEAIRYKGADIIELATGHKASRRLPAMLLRAYEMIASSGRAKKHDRPGRPDKWVFTKAEWDAAALTWASRKYPNDAERTLAVQRLLDKPIPRTTLRRRFGSPHGR